MCGEQCPFGCVESKGSFSERVMWRAGGQLVSYMYLTDRTAHCGEDWRWGKAAGDEWNEIRVYNRVNDVGAHHTSSLPAKHPQARTPLP